MNDGVVIIALVAFALVATAAPAKGGDMPWLNVLVTGFGPFLNYTTNPSGEVASVLNGMRMVADATGWGSFEKVGIAFEGVKIPVDSKGASFVSDRLSAIPGPVKVAPWSVVIHMGLEHSAKGLVVESVAANILAKNNSEPIVPGADSVLPTTAPLGYLELESSFARIRSASRSKSAWVASSSQQHWSRDAGGFYCNECYFRTLHAVRSRKVHPEGAKRGLLPAMFVHLPEAEDTSIADDAEFIKELSLQIILPQLLGIKG